MEGMDHYIFDWGVGGGGGGQFFSAEIFFRE